MLEVEIQKACQKYLDEKGFFHWRHNNIGVYDRASGGYRKFHGVRGVPDIEMVLEGFYVGIEVKRPEGQQSDHQVAFQRKLEANGAFYLLVHSKEELIAGLAEVQKAIQSRLVKYVASAQTSSAATLMQGA